MFLVSFWLWVGFSRATVPKVAIGPNNIERAPVIDAPIQEVYVFSDRARIHRQAHVHLDKGIHTIRLADVAGSLDPRSLRIATTQANILRIQSNIVERDQHSLEDLKDIIEQLEQLQREIALLNSQKESIAAELNRLQQTRPSAPVQEGQRTANTFYDSNEWRIGLLFLSNRQKDGQQQIRVLDEQIRLKQAAWNTLSQSASPFLEGPHLRTQTEIVVVLEVPSPQIVSLNIDYFTTNASWLPTYDVHYDADTDTARIETAALVFQHTGERWEQVRLHLSTSIPDARLEGPDLLTWTLGEKREYIPEPRSVRRPSVVPPFPPPTRQSTLLERERQSESEAVQEQIRHLGRLLERSPADGSAINREPDPLGGLSTKGNEIGSGGLGFSTRNRGGGSHPPPPTPEEEAAEEGLYGKNTVVQFSDYDMEFASAGQATKSKNKEGHLTASGQPGTLRSLPMEAPNRYRKATIADHRLPAHSANGMEYLWTAPNAFSIPSDGQQVRVPLSSTSMKATSYYETTPALQEMAYLKATVSNTGDQAILLGSANIFMNTSFSSQGELRTTVPGGSLELPLGADENIRIKRNITPMQRSSGLLHPQEITEYTVTIDIANYKQIPINVRVIDQIPNTNNPDIEIDLLSADPPFTQGPNATGIGHWDLSIAAGQTQSITFQYAIARPKNWQLWGN